MGLRLAMELSDMRTQEVSLGELLASQMLTIEETAEEARNGPAAAAAAPDEYMEIN